jgi:hypothetical protein
MRIAAISMIKNEDCLLEPWIKYHSKIFGAENIYIFDNGSSTKKCLEVLQEAEQSGINVNRDSPRPVDFEKKGAIISDFINSHMDQYDIFVPLDADEFFSLQNPDLFSVDKEAYYEEFQRIFNLPFQYYRINTAYGNLPGSSILQTGKAKKLIVKRGDPVHIDSGFHLYDWTNQRDSAPAGTMGECNFSHIHFHWRHYSDVLISAREKLKERVPNYRMSTLQNYKGAGIHLTGYFLIDHSRYGKPDPNSEKIDAAHLYSNLEIGGFPYGEPDNFDFDEINTLKDTLNIHYISKQSTLDIESLRVIRQNMKGVSSYFEFGLGGSTLLALESDIQEVVSVETRIEHITSTVPKLGLEPYIYGNRLHLKHYALGDTSEWGQPRVNPVKSKIYDYIHSHASRSPEMILIDGRYRIACCCSIYLRQDNPQIVFGNFLSKDSYGVLEEIYHFEQIGDTSMILRKKQQCATMAEKMLEKFILDVD